MGKRFESFPVYSFFFSKVFVFFWLETQWITRGKSNGVFIYASYKRKKKKERKSHGSRCSLHLYTQQASNSWRTCRWMGNNLSTANWIARLRKRFGRKKRKRKSWRRTAETIRGRRKKENEILYRRKQDGITKMFAPLPTPLGHTLNNITLSRSLHNCGCVSHRVFRSQVLRHLIIRIPKKRRALHDRCERGFSSRNRYIY